MLYLVYLTNIVLLLISIYFFYVATYGIKPVEDKNDIDVFVKQFPDRHRRVRRTKAQIEADKINKQDKI